MRTDPCGGQRQQHVPALVTPLSYKCIPLPQAIQIACRCRVFEQYKVGGVYPRSRKYRDALGTKSGKSLKRKVKVDIGGRTFV